MVKVVEMDEKVPLSKQLEKDVGPVILINTFTMNPDDVDQFLKIWTSAAEITKKFPGVISVAASPRNCWKLCFCCIPCFRVHRNHQATLWQLRFPVQYI